MKIKEPQIFEEEKNGKKGSIQNGKRRKTKPICVWMCGDGLHRYENIGGGVKKKMKRKAKFELVINEEKEIDGEKRHSGYVGVNGQPFRFWNLPIDGVRGHFLRTADFCLKEMEAQLQK